MQVLILLLGTIGCTIACSVTIVIPLAMIVVGSIYFDECPAEPHIPVFLIVGGDLNTNHFNVSAFSKPMYCNRFPPLGSFSVFKYLIGVLLRVRRSGSSDEDDNAPKGHPLQSLITCFLCGWFITGQ